MTDNINPSHYKDGPFECIELSRLLSSDWGQAVQYCFRWQHKNGVEDLKKALWFVNDALVHGIPIYAVSDWADLASALFHTLAREDWAGLKSVWDAFTVSGKCTYHNPRHTVYRYECVLKCLQGEVCQTAEDAFNSWIRAVARYYDAESAIRQFCEQKKDE